MCYDFLIPWPSLHGDAIQGSRPSHSVKFRRPPGNALIDGADPACAVCVPTSRVEKKKRACTDGADNDCNGLVDCADPSCSSTRSCKPARNKHRHHHHEDDADNGNENDAEQERDDDNDQLSPTARYGR